MILRVPCASAKQLLLVWSRKNAIIDCSDIIDRMPSIVIRNLDAVTKRKLKVRAAMNGRSMEREAREILKSALAQTSKRKSNLADRIREIFGPLGGVELERLPREAIRDPEWLTEGE
jgi:plasmid stability protein